MIRNPNSAATAVGVLIAALFIGLRVFRQVHPHPLTPYDSYIVFGAGIILVMLLMRTAVAATVPGSYTFPDARPEQYPQLDRATRDGHHDGHPAGHQYPERLGLDGAGEWHLHLGRVHYRQCDPDLYVCDV